MKQRPNCEKCPVVAGLGVPQHTKQEAPVRVLHGLDRAIEGPSSGCQAAGRAHPGGGTRGRWPRGRGCRPAGFQVHRHVMPGVLTGYGAVLVVADDVGQVLEQRAAVRDTEQLHAATNPEDGRWPSAASSIANSASSRFGRSASSPGSGSSPVPRQVDVRAAGENECVETGDDVQAGSGGNRTGCRPPLIAGDVALRQEHGRHVSPYAPARLLGVGGDTDDGTHDHPPPVGVEAHRLGGRRSRGGRAGGRRGCGGGCGRRRRVVLADRRGLLGCGFCVEVGAGGGGSARGAAGCSAPVARPTAITTTIATANSTPVRIATRRHGHPWVSS